MRIPNLCTSAVFFYNICNFVSSCFDVFLQKIEGFWARRENMLKIPIILGRWCTARTVPPHTSSPQNRLTPCAQINCVSFVCMWTGKGAAGVETHISGFSIFLKTQCKQEHKSSRDWIHHTKSIIHFFECDFHSYFATLSRMRRAYFECTRPLRARGLQARVCVSNTCTVSVCVS